MGKFNDLHEFNKIITVKGHVLYITIVMKPHSLLQTLKSSSLKLVRYIRTEKQTMFGFLFGWRKASKCKRALKQLQRRLNLLENKKHAISSHLRHDIVQLLRIGERDRALRRAHDLFLDENLVSLYHLLLQFSDVILLNLSYIRRHRELSDGVNEAVSTLIFASARCGDLPELRTLRALFGERYGKLLVSMALYLLPGNRVNPQVCPMSSSSLLFICKSLASTKHTCILDYRETLKNLSI